MIYKLTPAKQFKDFFEIIVFLSQPNVKIFVSREFLYIQDYY